MDCHQNHHHSQEYKPDWQEFGEDDPKMMATLKDGSRLGIWVSQFDRDVNVDLRYITPDGESFSTDRSQDYPKIDTVFPRKYWYGDRNQHEAFNKAIRAYFKEESVTMYRWENLQQIRADIVQYCGDYADSFDIEAVINQITVECQERGQNHPTTVVQWDYLDDALQSNELDDKPVSQEFRKAKSQAFDNKPSFNEAGLAPAQPQAGYAAPQYQQQQQFQQQQQAAGTQMSM